VSCDRTSRRKILGIDLVEADSSEARLKLVREGRGRRSARSRFDASGDCRLRDDVLRHIGFGYLSGHDGHTAAVAKRHGVKAFINMSQMPLAQMSNTEITASPQHNLQ